MKWVMWPGACQLTLYHCHIPYNSFTFSAGTFWGDAGSAEMLWMVVRNMNALTYVRVLLHHKLLLLVIFVSWASVRIYMCLRNWTCVEKCWYDTVSYYVPVPTVHWYGTQACLSDLTENGAYYMHELQNALVLSTL